MDIKELPHKTISPRCLYHASLNNFINCNNAEVLGKILESYHGDSQSTTIESWSEEIKILKEQLVEWANEDAHIIFEYNIPRLGKRIDVVLLLKGVIICVPRGNNRFNSEGFPEDATRLPEFYDSTYEYFKSIGITEI